MAISARFQVRMHEEYGMLGLKMVGRDWAEPLTGMAIAHDMMEHFPRDRGTIREELMALGASMLVRDSGNYFAQKGQAHVTYPENFEVDLVMQVTTYGGDNYWLPHAGRTCAIDEGWLDDQITESWERARKLLRYDAIDPDTTYLRTVSRRDFIGWVRRGYRKAKRRYHGIYSGTLCCGFMEIERLADQFLRYADEGMECIIRLEPKRGRATLQEVEYFE